MSIFKKAQITKSINKPIATIISILVIIVIFTNLLPSARTAGDDLTDANLCVGVGGIFNDTRDITCTNNNSDTGDGIAFTSIPISGVFGGSGLVFVLLMVGLLLTMIILTISRTKK